MSVRKGGQVIAGTPEVTRGHHIGEIFYTTRLDTALNGAVECDGAQYNVADFTGSHTVPALLADGVLPYVSIEAFDAAVAANGSCRAWGWDGSDATVFKVPKLNDVYIMAGTAASVGEFINESLPTSSVYQDGAKVRPDSVRYRAMVQIATGATDEALETCTSVIAGKANTSLDNLTTAGKSVVSGLGMPSDRYVDLTVGATGTRYTAPANGRFVAGFLAVTPTSKIAMTLYANSTSDLIINGTYGFGGNMASFVFASLSTQKNQSLLLQYYGTTPDLFRFVYAEGAE